MLLPPSPYLITLFYSPPSTIKAMFLYIGQKMLSEDLDLLQQESVKRIDSRL
jgi:hypothetical protein